MPHPGEEPADSSGAAPFAALIVGCGLIGTSIGMALRECGWRVALADRSAQPMSVAAGLGAGDPWGLWPAGPERRDVLDRPDVVIVAVPPSAIASACAAAQRLFLDSTVMHVCSVQVRPRAELEASAADATRIVGTHPMAGRETSGPAGASPALFVDRPWVVCPDPGHRVPAVVDAVIAGCGARRVDLAAAEHDEAVAVVSHLPQVVSSLLAGRLAAAAEGALAVAGTGVRDMTRLADGPPSMWTDILTGNAAAVGGELAALVADAQLLVRNLGGPEGTAAVRGLLERGREGRQRLGGKHGAARRAWASVQVVIPDTPGALVDVLIVCRNADVNIEDLSVDHALGQPAGVLELLVDPQQSTALATALSAGGWPVAEVSLPHD